MMEREMITKKILLFLQILVLAAATRSPTPKPTISPSTPSYSPTTATPSAPTVFVDYSCLHAQYMQMNCNKDKNTRVSSSGIQTEYTKATYTASDSTYFSGSTYAYATTGIPYYNHTVSACDIAGLNNRPHKSTEISTLKISTGSIYSFANDIGYSCSADSTDTTVCACIGSSSSNSDYDSYCNNLCSSCTPASYYTTTVTNSNGQSSTVTNTNMEMCNLYSWPPGPKCPEEQTATLTVPLKPRKNTKTSSSSGCYVPLGQQGYFVNGVSLYSWFDGASYNDLDYWHQIAAFFEIYDFDICLGHGDITNIYHHHTYSHCLAETIGDSGYAHSPVYGFARDGFPIYGPWQSSGTLVQSCWKKRDYSGTASKAGGWGCGTNRRSCLLDNPFNPTTVTKITSSANYGPYTNASVYSMSGEGYTAVSGSYWEDYYYDTSCGSSGGEYLDANNGHDHDNLGWHYHMTVDSSNTPVFPFAIGPQFYGMLGSADSEHCCNEVSSNFGTNGCATTTSYSNYNNQVTGTGYYSSTDSCTGGFSQSSTSSSTFQCSSTMSKSTYVDHFCIPTIAPTGPSNIPSPQPSSSSTPTISPTNAPVSSSPSSFASGSIKTVAGVGTTSTSIGDGTQATSASLYTPYGVALDSTGNVYIADKGNNRIRKVTVSTGIITTIAGIGTAGYTGDNLAATSAALNGPYGVSLDTSDNFYIADSTNNRVRKVTVSTGFITTVAGTGTASSTGDGGAATSATLISPSGLALDSSGNIYIATNNRIRKVTVSTGIIATIAGTGTSSYSGDNGAATSATLNSPNTVVLDSSGNIYIADRSNNRIRKITISTGIITTIAGSSTMGGYSGDNGQATSAKLSSPYGVSLDSSGNIYIGDSSNYRVRKVTVASGIITTVAGTGTGSFSGDNGAATNAALYLPTAIAVDTSGNVFIADTFNNRIREVVFAVPSMLPTAIPTAIPTTVVPSTKPSSPPTYIPGTPTSSPVTVSPTNLPTIIPTRIPTETPTEMPTETPTVMPTAVPTALPSVIPTTTPTRDPTPLPGSPTATPSTATPSELPTATPSDVPTNKPSAEPTALPTAIPTSKPTRIPSTSPTFVPTNAPTTSVPSTKPISSTNIPTAGPTALPSMTPSTIRNPSPEPTKKITDIPTIAPTDKGDENVMFSVGQVVSGISLTDWNNDRAKNEVVFAKSVSLVSGIDVSDITIDGVISYNLVMTTRQSLKFRKLTTSSVQITYSIEFITNEYADDDYVAHSEDISEKIYKSLSSGNFTTTLQKTAAQYNSASLQSASSNVTGFTHTKAEIQSNSVPDESTTKTDDAGVIAGSVIAVLVVTLVAYYMYQQRRRKSMEEAALNGDGHDLSYGMYGGKNSDSLADGAPVPYSNVEMTTSSSAKITNPILETFKRPNSLRVSSHVNEDTRSSGGHTTNPLLSMKVKRITLKKPPAAPIKRITLGTAQPVVVDEKVANESAPASVERISSSNQEVTSSATNDDDDDDERGPRSMWRYEEQQESFHL